MPVVIPDMMRFDLCPCLVPDSHAQQGRCPPRNGAPAVRDHLVAGGGTSALPEKSGEDGCRRP